MKKQIWNIGYSEICLQKLLIELDQILQNNSSCKTIAFINPHTQVSARHDDYILKCLNTFDYILCDGIGSKLAAKLFAGYKIERLSGPALFRLFSEHLNHKGNEVSYFFLGSTDIVLNKIVKKMELLYPCIPVVGIYSPPMCTFSKEDNANIIQKVNDSKCSVLWVGLTAPKQERWIVENIANIDAHIASGIGAEFDYFAGTRPRPAQWISSIGLQWLHRLVTQPGTWRRTVISTPIFIANIVNFWFETKMGLHKD